MVHSQHRRSTVAAVSRSFRRRPVEASGDAGDGGIPAHRLSHLDVPADAYVKLHRHKIQEQVYHVIEGEGLMHIAGEDHVVRKHDIIYLPPGIDHAISNTGLVDLVFLVVTSPVGDDLTSN
jgi:mannose-6-phosphate isomerase-like protein (cupin superfamily)